MTKLQLKSRICFLTSSFYPIIGGAESYILTLIEELAKKGYEIIVITDHTPIPFTPLKIPRVEIIRLKDYNTLYHDETKIRWEQMYFALLNDISKVLTTHQIDLIHANSQDSAILGSMLALSLKVPFVVSMHEHNPESEPFGDGRCQLIYEHLPINRILVGSEYYNQRAKRYCSDVSKIAFIYHGIDMQIFSPHVDGTQFRHQLQINNEQFLIVSVGRLKQRKGHLELVEVARNLRYRLQNFHILIAGSRSSTQAGYAEMLYQTIQDYNLQPYITIDETLTPHEMPAVYAAADMVIHPSYEEGLGLAVLEAMSTQVPVLTTSVPGIIEIMKTGKEALLVNSPKDIAGLTDAIIHIYSDINLREALIKQAYATVKEHFSLNRMVAEIEEIYNSLITNRSVPS